MGRMKKVAMVGPVEKKWLSSAEAKKYLDCSDEYLLKLRNEAAISFSAYGRVFWYDLASIDRFIVKHKVV